jgi:hypothetical protein
MDLKQSAIKAINRAFSSEGGKLNNLESSNAKDSIVKQIQKNFITRIVGIFLKKAIAF